MHSHLLFSLFLLLCSAAQKTRASLMKTSSRSVDPGHLPVVRWCPFPPLSPFGLVIKLL
jgi:hypothetical protein